MKGPPNPAQYLLRVDDLCPTLDEERWPALRGILHEFRIRPILAVVPDNRDPHLVVSSPREGFWDEMLAMQDEGATIALHGYQHLCLAHGKSLVPLHRDSEFAGAEYEEQFRRIRSGLQILQSRGLQPRLFVAPRHGFDRNTIRALEASDLLCLCDGFARMPFRRLGVTWIPQQLWAPVPKSKGIWTICLHPNSMTPSDLNALRDFLREYARQFTQFEQVAAECRIGDLPLQERILGLALRWRKNHRLPKSVRSRLLRGFGCASMGA